MASHSVHQDLAPRVALFLRVEGSGYPTGVASLIASYAVNRTGFGRGDSSKKCFIYFWERIYEIVASLILKVCHNEPGNHLS